MHICHCYKDFSLSEGGIEQVMRHLATAAINAGHRVSAVVSRPSGVPAKELFKGTEEYRTPFLFKMFKVPIMPNYYKCLASLNPDIIHAYGTLPNVSDVAILYASKHNKPSILHYQYDGNADSWIGKILAGVYNLSINRYTAQKATRVIATSHSYEETSSVLKSVLKKVEIIPNGVSMDLFNQSIEDNNIRGKYNIPAGRIILFAGRLVKYKGTGYLIRAMKHVKGANLVIAGTGEEERNLKKLVYQLNLSNVKFVGLIANEELPYFHKISDLFVLPSITRNENFGIVALEAMACGKPVVASDLPGVRELVTEECGIKVKPKDITGLASAINMLLGDYALSEKMGIAARKNAEKYSWDSISQRILEIYEELVK
jgi:glycosyltransferase involved in cell wall biosynthesis